MQAYFLWVIKQTVNKISKIENRKIEKQKNSEIKKFEEVLSSGKVDWHNLLEEFPHI